MAATELKKLIKNLGEDTDRLYVPAKDTTSIFRKLVTNNIQEELDDIIELKYPLVKFKDLVLAVPLKGALQRILDEQSKIDLFRSHGIKARKKILFSGSQGCGKTISAQALASELELPLFTIHLGSLISRYKEESIFKLRRIFDSINNFRAVYLFDDTDRLDIVFPDVNKEGLNRILYNLQVQLEKAETHSLIIVANNTLEESNTHFLKVFDDIICFRQPLYSEVLAFYRSELGKFNLAHHLDLELAAEKSLGLTFSDLKIICSEVIKDHLLYVDHKISQDDIIKYVESRKTYIRLIAASAMITNKKK